MVPGGLASVLEVGCGDGLIINQVATAETMGVDVSAEGLSKVTGPSLQCSVAELPFEDGRYKLVIASELLEHLPDENYRQALSEIARVAGRFILVSVPNHENLRANATRCPACGHEYHRALHQRSYRQRDLEGLFDGFATVECRPMGPVEAERTGTEAWLRRMLDWGVPVPWGTTCPYCGSAHIKPGEAGGEPDVTGDCAGRDPMSRRLMRLVRRHRKPWIAGLYSRVSPRTP